MSMSMSWLRRSTQTRMDRQDLLQSRLTSEAHSDNYAISELIERVHTKLFQASPCIDVRRSLKKLCMDVFNQLAYGIVV